MSAGCITTQSELSFAVFCIEAVAEVLGADPRDVLEALTEKSDILDDYVVRYHESLHTQDKYYIADDIIREMAAEGGERAILYHGSSVAVPQPDVFHSRSRVDFGRGFYTTPLYDQAAHWCRRFMRHGSAYVSSYELDDDAFERFSILEFASYSEAWLDFVFECRRGEDRSPYDIVAGGVANDKVFDTIEFYFEGLIGKQEALGRLRFERPNWQVCIRPQRVIDECLRYLESVSL